MQHLLKVLTDPDGEGCENCGSPEAQYVVDPFLNDVHNEIVYRWLCDRCLETRADDI